MTPLLPILLLGCTAKLAVCDSSPTQTAVPSLSSMWSSLSYSEAPTSSPMWLVSTSSPGRSSPSPTSSPEWSSLSPSSSPSPPSSPVWSSTPPTRSFSSSPSPPTSTSERPRQRAYARPYIQRVWLSGARDPAAYRANHSHSIRSFALAINDTDTFLRFLREEERRLGLRLGTSEDAEDGEGGDGGGSGDASEGARAAQEFASAFASAAAAASASASREGSSAQYEDNSVSGDMKRMGSAQSIPEPSQPSPSQREGPRARWVRPPADEGAAAPASALPFASLTTQRPSYRGLTAAPSEQRNRTAPYTVTPHASFYGANASFVYETYAARRRPSASGFLEASERKQEQEERRETDNKITASDASDSSDVSETGRAERLPEASALVADSASRYDASTSDSDADAALRNAQGAADPSSSSSSSSGGDEEPEADDRSAAPSAFVQLPPHLDVRRPPDSGHAGPYFGLRRLKDDTEADVSTSGRTFRNRPMVPMSDSAAVYNLQTAPRDFNRSERDEMVMSPSTIGPNVVEVYTVPPRSYYVGSSFVNATDGSREYQEEQSYNHFVESRGGYSELRSNEMRAEKKHSSRYHTAVRNPLESYNPFSIFPKYRATFVPKREHSVKVLSNSQTAQPPPSPAPTLVAYVEEPYAQPEQRRALAASRGASGALAPAPAPAPSDGPADTPSSTAPADVTLQPSTASPSTAAPSYALPVYYSHTSGSRAHGRAAPYAMSAHARRPKTRRRHRRPGHRRHHRNHHRRTHGHAHGGVARALLPPSHASAAAPGPRRRLRVSAALAGAPQLARDPWQWQESHQHHNGKHLVASEFSKGNDYRSAPNHASVISSTYAPSFTSFPPNYSPSYTSTYSPSSSSSSSIYSPTSAPSTLALSSTTAAPSAEGPKSWRSGRTPQHGRRRVHSPNALTSDEGLSAEEAAHLRRKEKVSFEHLRPEGIGEHGSIPGEPGRDYPIYSKPPVRNFSCLDLQGRRGYVADPSTRCQVFYICPGDGRGKAMLCPNGTVFNEEVSVCDWWFNVKCGDF